MTRSVSIAVSLLLLMLNNSMIFSISKFWHLRYSSKTIDGFKYYVNHKQQVSTFVFAPHITDLKNLSTKS